ncbi:Calx-beta domain-containing protein [Pseudanabaena sp. PCC 6802]|uniref:Calx-beta domain-containing protein n=1 Tax=Pseudanabaena sp. PCC 6802 TaxID=118173 RepID=UPI00034CC29D|nr:Calx-beta domain-containing protein [Pseudanabaena sp. PCC 6802]
MGTIGFGNTVVINVDENVGSVTIPILYSGDLFPAVDDQGNTAKVTITYGTRNGTNTNAATEGQDYLAIARESSISFPQDPDPRSIPVTIPIIDDTDAEITESFVLDIISINGASGAGTRSVVINILDNDSGQGATVPPGSNPTFGPEAPFFPTFVDGNNEVVGTGGNDTLYGGKGNDSLTGLFGNDTLYGGQDQDVLFGNDDNDFLFGNKGNDNLFGGEGDDILYGGQGNDTIYGNDGNDFLAGDIGVDVLAGAGGSDRFAIQAGKQTDYVADFTVSEDLLALTGGLQFGDISIFQSGNDTVLRLNSSGEDLMVLVNTQAFLVTGTSFITV